MDLICPGDGFRQIPLDDLERLERVFPMPYNIFYPYFIISRDSECHVHMLPNLPWPDLFNCPLSLIQLENGAINELCLCCRG